MARKKPVRSKSHTAMVEEKTAVEAKPADSPAEATPYQPVADASPIEPGTLSLLWILLMLFLLLFFVVRRDRRKASDTERTVISR